MESCEPGRLAEVRALACGNVSRGCLGIIDAGDEPECPTRDLKGKPLLREILLSQRLVRY